MKTNLSRIFLTLISAVALVTCKDPPPKRSDLPPSSPADGRSLILPAGIASARVLDQNWTDSEARRWYNISQGSQMMPYSWFLCLEQAGSTTPFRDAANMLRMGYLPRKKDDDNGDALPVGFAKNGIHVGLTCAACHTGFVTFKGTGWLIDGGATMADAALMMRELEAAMKATLADDVKFGRLATAVLGTPLSNEQRTHLKADFERVTNERAAYNARNMPHDPIREFGPGRIDAFGAIMNEVAVRFAQVPGAKTMVDAPVSYPFLWDTPQHDKVQWNGSAENTVSPIPVFGTRQIGALGRNIGEVLGVFGDVNTTKQEIPFGGYPSSVNKANLNELEDLLRKLWSPKWPKEFGEIDPKYGINEDLRARGEILYVKYCADCHAIPQRENPTRKIEAIMRVVDTDETMARNVATRQSGSGIFQDRVLVQLPPADPILKHLGATENLSDLLSHLGQRVIIGSELVPKPEEVDFRYVVHAQVGEEEEKVSVVLTDVKVTNGEITGAKVKSSAPVVAGKKAISSAGVDLKRLKPRVAKLFSAAPGESQEKMSVMKRSAAPSDAPVPVRFEYKARPLNGIWATGPYLHNGSVRTLAQLLEPSAGRQTTFKVGSLELDPDGLGFADNGNFVFDTRAQAGNSNAGHEGPEYGTELTPEEKRQLLEYLKSL